MIRSARLSLAVSGFLLAGFPTVAQDATPTTPPTPPAGQSTPAPAPSTPAPADPAATQTAPAPPVAEAVQPPPAPVNAAPASGEEVTPFSNPSADNATAAVEASGAADGDLDIATDILMVRVLGPWASGDDSGFSRAIGKVEDGALLLFVQWISDEGEIIQTKAIEQDAQTPQLALASVRSEPGDGESAAYFDTPEDDQGFRETFVLMVGAPGEARFGPATN